MARRGRFVPTSPDCSMLERRDTPSNIWGSVGSWFDKLGDQIGITHPHKSSNAAAGIQDLWNNSDKLSKPTKVHPVAVAKSALKFK